MNLTVPLAVLIGTLVLACSTTVPAPADATPNIDSTVEARVAQEQAVDATVQPEAPPALSTETPKTSNEPQEICKLTGGETVKSGWTG